MSEPLDQVWPIFEAETREQVQALAAGFLELEEGPAGPDAVPSLKRLTHSLKGSAASLGLMELERVAHALEDLLDQAEGGRPLQAEQVAAALRGCTAIEASLSSNGRGQVDELEAILAGLGAAGPAGRPTPPPPAGDDLEALATEIAALCRLDAGERSEHAARARETSERLAAGLTGPAGQLARGLTSTLGELVAAGPDAPRLIARAAAEIVQLRAQARPRGPAARKEAAQAPAPGRELRDREGASVRVEVERLDRVAAELDQLAVSSSRHERRGRELGRIEQSLHEGLRQIRGALDEHGREPGERAPAVAAGLERLQALAGELGREAREARRSSQQDRLVVQRLRQTVQDLRMVPASNVLSALRATVRDLAGRLDKEVALRTAGGEVRLDRRVLEGLKAPLLHLVRNALDHGIEDPGTRKAAGKPAAGVVEVQVEQRGDRIAVTVRDDGRGLSPEHLRAAAVERGLLTAADAGRLGDAEAARLAFRPGLSTAPQVTALSGRGVGLDVVGAAVQGLGGEVEVSFERGGGTTFRLDVPLTIAGSTGVLVRAAGGLALVPAEAVEEVLLIPPGGFRTAGEPTVSVAGREVPFLELAEAVGQASNRGLAAPADTRVALLVSSAGKRVALGVDEVLGDRPMVVSALGRRVRGAPHVSGAAVLDDGRVVAVLRPSQLVSTARPTTAPAPPRGRIVVADDSPSTRAVVKSMLEIAGYEVLTATDGEAALAQVRGGRTQLVISDVQMPVLGGLDLTRRLRSTPGLERLPVILVTSLAAPEERAAGLAAGADAYLVKQEMRTGKLLEIVRQLLPG